MTASVAGGQLHVSLSLIIRYVPAKYGRFHDSFGPDMLDDQLLKPMHRNPVRPTLIV